ncbi:MAG: pseudouridine synthase [Candidatus Thalassarchaeaceae archaeon]|jgi:16S rRNA pseudouridine516 synthase|nr:hypothetical protein [Euryarchaeota archaeon]MDP6870636.1 pseudouridine synthase [Candidatus Thalassarchaeaceae archaeon]|tara:strand:+ start:2946 stop:3722 length:777 start_codon:yes stop_codon:yes gene_type:complete
MKIRLHQFLSKSGAFSSKSEVKRAIWGGEIMVNDSPVKDITYEFNPEKRVIKFRGDVLELPLNERYFLLNKPAGVICSRLNKHEASLGKRSVFERFNDPLDSRTFRSLVTVGRLDEGTTGLLIVTTDGNIVHTITNPNSRIGKSYRVRTTMEISEKQATSIRDGVTVETSDGGVSDSYTSRPAELVLEGSKVALVTIYEGKKRQIRRIFEAVGNNVVDLHRLSIGNMVLSDYGLDEGDFCEVELGEISSKILNDDDSS